MSLGERPAFCGQSALGPGGQWGPAGEGAVQGGGGYHEEKRVRKKVLGEVRRRRGIRGED